MKDFSEFSGYKNGYPVSKTLRFELKPQGKTEEWINKSPLLKDDEKKAKDYKNVKKIIDNYHRYFIDEILQNAKLDWSDLQKVLKDYQKDKTKNKELEEVQKKMRLAIGKLFSEDERFKVLTAPTPKDLFNKLLPEYLPNLDNTDLKKEAIETFKRFSTYFKGFQENRKNVYSIEPIATAVPYRIVHDNFPKFIQNIDIYNYLIEKSPKVISDTEKELAEILCGKKLKDVFTVNAFNDFLMQKGSDKQKGIDFYNQIIGGVSEKAGTNKLKGINEHINLYWQQNSQFAKDNHKVKMQPLFKQILSDRSTLSFKIESVETDKELENVINEYYQSLDKGIEIDGKTIPTLSACYDLFKDIDQYQLSKVFINKKDLTEVSQVLFGKWDELQIRMNHYAEATFKNSKEKARWIKDTTEPESSRKPKGEFSFEELNKVLNFCSDDYPATEIRMKDYFSQRYQFKYDTETDSLKKTDEVKYLSLQEEIDAIKESCKTMMAMFEKKNDEPLRERTTDTELIKNALDNVQNLLHRIKPLNASADAEKDTNFYETYDKVYESLSEIIQLYNKVRNFITKKALDPGKYKLNFENPTLADGWDLNKEDSNLCVILSKDNNYYLGIMNAKNKPKFSEVKSDGTELCYKKMFYKYFKDLTTMVPKCSTQLNEVKKHFEKETDDILISNDNFLSPLRITNEIFDLNNTLYDGKKKFQIEYWRNTNDKAGFDHAVKTWIQFCLDFIKIYKSTSVYDMSSIYKKQNEYKQLDQFYSDVNSLLYKITFTDIPESTIDVWVDEGKLYLFQIYNKDFASGANGNPNLHTLYWKNLFNEENLEDTVLKLNGQAELFYRNIGIKTPSSHKVGEKMVNRTTKDGEPIPENVHDEIFKYVNGKIKSLSEDAKKIFDSGNVTVKDVKHEIIKDKHYTEAKFLFHVPITINFKASDKNSYLNERARTFLHNNPDVNVIGLDRGERNLIYLTLINRKGEIITQKSFNTVDRLQNNKNVSINYHEKLDQREKERDAARKNWQTIGKIAELKEGYLSAVIHEITKMMIEYNAIVVMEDLNFGFKQGRFHVEKQVYQKFEHMLIDKLNYLVFKDVEIKKTGGVLNGYQLTEKFVSFQKLGKQSGVLFYVPAGYTSKIDPQTGFVNLLDLKGLTNVEKKRDFFSKFKEIKFDSATDSFAFTFDYKDFGGKGAEEMARTKWTIYSFGERIKFCGRNKSAETIDLTKGFKTLLKNYQINWNTEENLIDSIMEIGSDKETVKERQIIKFYDDFYRLFTLVLQMRNSNAKTDDDYIISPVKNKNGKFFDSREQLQFGDKAKLPKDADANGAYHIALKGLYLLERFDKVKDGQFRKVEMTIKNKDWFAYRQK